ncbi:elongator complex protein 6 [Teleopsis dalmanni]|uniref:elongator complex protein 6 n=1 Tax=Teleopsis dalmanni TaxID=139649 RepID=UPI0018CFEC44|nr:elongator complex protein 6 [Teleopsis dalmanni]XP_037956898.1 elongator complex protein 6 [Teleopsis dalmanni]
MAASILSACGLNEQKLPAFVHISEESDMDGSFLISCILGQRLRISNAGALLVCLQHNYQHYLNAGLRLGYNANIFLDKTLNIIDPLSAMARDGVNSQWLEDEEQITSLLLTAIREQIETNFTNRISTTILIDNLSILLNLGATKEQVMQLCQELANFPKEYQNLTVITKMSNCDINELVDNNVAKLGDIRIRVKKLKSGFFREVDGKLLVERDLDAGPYKTEETHKEILYKVNDRFVKIHNPGEVGIKI